MKILTSYRVRIQGYGSVLDDTVAVYRKAVDFFIAVMMEHWDRKCAKFCVCQVLEGGGRNLSPLFYDVG